MTQTEPRIPERLRREIVLFARKRAVHKIILFGSRATGKAGARSDVDLAVCGGDFDGFYLDLTEHAHTLLSFDLIDYDNAAGEELKKEIVRDGIVLYEKAG